MSAMSVGELFAGYGGLSLAMESLTLTRTAWVSEIAKASARVLAYRYPDAPNLGDVTAVDWHAVEPVDVISGGSPCQDLSTAGRRAGMRPGTRSGLWGAMTQAIDALRPPLVVWENVQGALSAGAYSDMESGPGCVGDVPGGPALRALGRVLGDLADLGYDAQWQVLAASDVGAPHQRKRVFVLAHRRGDDRAEDCAARLIDQAALIDSVRAGTSWRAERLLPTPVVNDMGASYTVEAWDEWTSRLRESHGNGNGHGASLSVEVRRLLPTVTAHNGQNGASVNGRGEPLLPGAVHDMGPYMEACHRWEQVTGRPIPPPVEDGRLSPRFTEWMMGLPDGWITDVPDVSRREAITMCGNGVVPQQAAAALAGLAVQAVTA